MALQLLVVYPISQGLKLNTALYAIDFSQEGILHPQPWVTEVNGDELVHRLDGWADEPRNIVAVSTTAIFGMLMMYVWYMIIHNDQRTRKSCLIGVVYCGPGYCPLGAHVSGGKWDEVKGMI